MSVKIRLSIIGKKHQKSYRIVVAETRSKRDGKPVEIVGFYSPLQKPPVIKLDEDRIKYWLAKGASMTDEVKNIRTKAQQSV